MFFSLHSMTCSISSLGGLYVRRGLCPTENRRGFCPGGLLSRGILSRGILSWTRTAPRLSQFDSEDDRYMGLQHAHYSAVSLALKLQAMIVLLGFQVGL